MTRLGRRLRGSFLSKFKLVILDFDGTLIDTMPALTDVAMEILDEFYGITGQRARSLYMGCIGAPFRQQLEFLFPNREVNDEAARKFERRKPVIYETVELCSGVSEALSLLYHHQVNASICSSTREELVHGIVMRYDLAPKMRSLKVAGNVGGDDKAFQIHDLVRENDVLHKETVLIGDAPRDSWYATWTGVKFLGVENTVSHEAFVRQGAHSVLNILAAVREILEI